MAYRKSTARLEFEAWKTRTLRVVAKAEKNYAVKADLSDYTLCAALLLTHAHFENYVKDICAFFVQNVNSKGLRADSLPGRLRECALLATFPHVDFKHFYTFGDERSLIDKLSIELKSKEWKWSQNNRSETLDVQAVIGDSGYPSPTNLKRLFYKLGIVNIHAELGKRLHTDVESLLDGIGGLRCEMAHVGMPPLVTAGDIADRIRKLAAVVGCLDRIIQRQVSAL